MPASLPLFLTPPCSSSEHANNTAGKHQQELINHANFFQSVVALKSLSTMSSAYFSSTTLETLHRVLQMLQPWLCGGADFELSDSCAAFAVEAVTVLLSSSGLKLDCVAAISDAVLEMTQYLLKNVAEYDWSYDKVGTHEIIYFIFTQAAESLRETSQPANCTTIFTIIVYPAPLICIIIIILFLFNFTFYCIPFITTMCFKGIGKAKCPKQIASKTSWF